MYARYICMLGIYVCVYIYIYVYMIIIILFASVIIITIVLLRHTRGGAQLEHRRQQRLRGGRDGTLL